MPLLPLKPKSVKHGKTLRSLSLKTECLPEDSEERQTTATALLLLCVQRGGWQIEEKHIQFCAMCFILYILHKYTNTQIRILYLTDYLHYMH